MCHDCPTRVSYRDHGQTLTVERCEETLVAPLDIATEPSELDRYEQGSIWLVTLKARLRGPQVGADFALHGVPDGEHPGECALGNASAMLRVVAGAMLVAERGVEAR